MPMHRLCNSAVVVLAFISILAFPTLAASGQESQISKSEFEIIQKPGKLTVLMNPNARWTSYNALFVKPAKYEFSSTHASGPKVKPAAAECLTGHMEKALRKNLQPGYDIVEGPRPGAISIEAGVLNVDPSRPLLNAATMAVAFFPIDGGGATLRVTLADSMTGEVLAEIITEGSGSFYRPWQNLETYGHAREVMNQKAKAVRKLLDELGIGKSSRTVLAKR